MSPGDLITIDYPTVATHVALRHKITWAVMKPRRVINHGEVCVVLESEGGRIMVLTPASHIGWVWACHFRTVSSHDNAITGSILEEG